MQSLFHTRGGVMFWADSLGAKYVYNRLEAWSKDYGGFFKPCGYLTVRARQNASLVRPGASFLFCSFIDTPLKFHFFYQIA
jgi:hypothetical protein